MVEMPGVVQHERNMILLVFVGAQASHRDVDKAKVIVVLPRRRQSAHLRCVRSSDVLIPHSRDTSKYIPGTISGASWLLFQSTFRFCFVHIVFFPETLRILLHVACSGCARGHPGMHQHFVFCVFAFVLFRLLAWTFRFSRIVCTCPHRLPHHPTTRATVEMVRKSMMSEALPRFRTSKPPPPQKLNNTR